MVAAGNADPGLQGLFTSFRANTPWLYLDIDRTQAKTMGVSISEVFDTLQVYLGSLYVNDFNRFGRTWQVNVQADADFRKQIEDLKQLKVRNDRGRRWCRWARWPASATISGPVMIIRYNMYPAAPINGNAGAGRQLGPGDRADGRRRRQASCRRSMRSEWTELALLQLQTGNTAMCVFVLAVVLVFLVLAAQYESWSLPLAVILVVPMCLLCSIAGVVAGADGHQHLHAGRLRRAGRPGLQERDPDRRVRQGRSARPARRGARPRWTPASCGCGRSS